MNPFNATQNNIQKYYYEILSTTMTVNLLDEKRKKCKNEGRRKVCQSKLFYYDCFIFQTKNEMKMNQDEKENLIK